MVSLLDRPANSLIIAGRSYEVNTDFRAWLALANNQLDPVNLFLGDVPVDIAETVEAIKAFMTEGDTGEPTGERALDFKLDSDYIYGAFLQAYGIDLIDTEHLHYHKFLALLKALPEDTALSKIIGYRLYSGEDKELLAQKSKWQLPRELSGEEEALKRDFEEKWG